METLEDACTTLGAVDGSTLTVLATTEWTPDALAKLGDRAPALLALDATLRAHFGRPHAIEDRAMQRTLRGPLGELVMTWAAGSAARRELWLADPIGCSLAGKGTTKVAARRALAERVLRGPRLDALRAATHLTKLAQLDARALARLDLVVCDLGAAREPCGDVGRWLLSSDEVLGALVTLRVRGSLRDRVLAARLLAIGADGCNLDDAAARGAHLRAAVRALVAHPEPRVWVAAAHAAGRLTARSADVRAWLLSWLRSPSKLERRRAVTAIACSPEGSGIDVGRELTSVLDDPDVWTRAALGPAAPVLACDHRDLWDAFVARLGAPDAPIEVLWSAAQGLVALRAGGDRRAASIAREILGRAREAKPTNPAQAQLWTELTRDLEIAESGRSEEIDAEIVLERLVGQALAGDERVACERASRAAEKLAAGAMRGWTLVVAGGDAVSVGRACASLDAVARSHALALWEPIAVLAEQPAPRVSLDEAAKAALASLASPGASFVTVRAGLRLVGLVLDASAPRDRGPAVAALFAALSTRAREKDSKGRGLEQYEKPIADVAARALEAVAPDGEGGIARLAAWAALAGHDASILASMARADTLARTAGMDGILGAAGSLYAALARSAEGALEGRWGGAAAALLESLQAGETRLAQATSLLASLLRDSRDAVATPSTGVIVPLVRDLGRVTAYLRALVADPVIALEAAGDLRAFLPENDVVVERSVAQGERLGADVDALVAEWAAGLGPVFGELIGGAARALLGALVQRNSSRPEETRLGRYRVLEVMHVHGMGEIWLVEDDHHQRFVAKLAKGALTGTGGPARDRLVQALAGEVASVFDVRHPNVARVYAADFANDPPFVLMEYLVGADLEEWSTTRVLTIDELKPIVADVASGLRALHARGLVHCDMKPSNVYLRLDVEVPKIGRFRFEPHHRDGAIRDAVVIDFGISHRQVPGSGVAANIVGTFGFMPPEQARQETPTPKADVYGLAATIYAALTGGTFFGDSSNLAQYLHRHGFEEPLAQPGSLQALDPRAVSLLRAATQLETERRIGLDQLAEAFALI